MSILDDNESKKYVGGGKTSAILGVIFASIVSFALGIYDGLKNPIACRKA